MTNPFNPAPGALPSRIVGREPELSAIREALRRAEARSAPVPLVFVGQRGMGKTVLLRELRELAGKTSLSVPLEILEHQSLAETLRDKLDDLVTTVESGPAKALGALEKTLNDAGAISIEGEERETLEKRTLGAMLGALVAAARAAKRFVTITIDEFQDADVRSMGTLVRFVHESAQTDLPILLACAGLSESYALFEKLRTYVQRWDTFELRLLTNAETIEAIREPIVDARASIDEAALRRLADESGGYPFFVQTYASAAWEAHRGRTVTLADVESSLPPVRARNEMSFYVRPLARLTPRETTFALALADLGPGAHDIGAVARSIGLSAPDVSSTRATLVKKSIVAVPIPGKVEFRIPFTDRYLREHRDAFDTPEVRAYRRARSRG